MSLVGHQQQIQELLHYPLVAVFTIWRVVKQYQVVCIFWGNNLNFML